MHSEIFPDVIISIKKYMESVIHQTHEIKHMKKIMHISMLSRFFISRDQDVSRTAGMILESKKKKSENFQKLF